MRQLTKIVFLGLSLLGVCDLRLFFRVSGT